jgi:hypothetical protein
VQTNGNQGASNDGTRIMKEWYEAGFGGDVHTIHAWTDRQFDSRYSWSVIKRIFQKKIRL